MESKQDFLLEGPAVQIVEKCGAALCNILHIKYGIMASIHDVDIDSDWNMTQPNKAPVVQEKRFEAVLPSGVKVSVWKADLTNLRVDAVVNAANAGLQHYGGLADALSKAGGPKIQAESENYIRLYGKLKTGDAVTLGSGKLPCKMIIHAVGPQLSDPADYRSSEPLLKKAITSILDRVEEDKIQTVAIPAISSGLFLYPLKECANTIVKTVKKYYDNAGRQAHFPKEILLANHDDPTVNEIERACQLLLSSQSPQPSYSQAAASAKPRGPAHTVQLGSVHVTLEKAFLEDQQTDVIVNTASVNRNLDMGAISRSLLQRAGFEMQQEIQAAPGNGPVIETDAYRLKCKKVFHTFCPEMGAKNAERILTDSVKECLQMAGGKYKSISFPAIGTGGLGFSKNRVAVLMSKEVADFAKKCAKKIEVHFVIYPHDKATFEAFEEQMKNLQKKAASISSPPDKAGGEDRMESSSYRTPHINLAGPCAESIDEAKKWLMDLLLNPRTSVQIQNNFIQHLTTQDCRELSRLQKNGVTLEEFLAKGHACIDIRGKSPIEVAIATLRVESMLCTVQKEFVADEEDEMKDMTSTKVTFERKAVYLQSEFSSTTSALTDLGLCILKVEKVENQTLKMLFDLKKNQLGCSTTRKMFQRIPAQFCEMVCRIGFHVECAPPEDPEYGEGIYFAGTVKKASEMWKEKKDAYVYFVEADVLTGKSTRGKPGLILPPEDPQMYASVDGGPDISVIFSGYQALPRYIITCCRFKG